MIWGSSQAGGLAFWRPQFAEDGLDRLDLSYRCLAFPGVLGERGQAR